MHRTLPNYSVRNIRNYQLIELRGAVEQEKRKHIFVFQRNLICNLVLNINELLHEHSISDQSKSIQLVTNK